VLAVDDLGVGNLPEVGALLRMGGGRVALYCESFPAVPKRITLDIDDTFDAVHGGQQLRLFNAHYDEYGFQPIVVFDGEGRFVTAVLRPAKRPSGKEIKPFLRRLLRAIRAHWPNTEILLRADSHYCGPEVLDGAEVPLPLKSIDCQHRRAFVNLAPRDRSLH
jgi:Transposase DDE domain group 1